MRILIVEDDRALNQGVALALAGDEVLQAHGAAEAREKFDPGLDLVILDVNLPDGDGFALCRELRAIAPVPLIFLTADDIEADIVSGLESGADDYVTKPFSLNVLRARVNAVRRRRMPEGERFREGAFDFDFERMRFLAGGEPVELSRSEQRLLRLLVANRGTILTRDALIDRVWSDGEEFVEGNALSVAVGRLRKKLPGIPLRTVYGVGYVWEKRT